MLCPCGTKKNYTDCCGPILSGEKNAATPEALMRSRYTAFTEKNADYLFDSMTPELQENNDHQDLQDFVEEVNSWIKLEIIDAPPVSSYATEGNVEFAAYFMYDGKQQRIHENSHFIQHEGKWLYAGHIHQCSSHSHHHHDHEHDHHHTHEPYVAETKIGRNDACPCGSGKKYKKCCME